MFGGLGGDAEDVFGGFVEEAAPGGGVLREDDGPFGGVDDHVEAVAAGGEGLAVDRDRVRDGEDGAFIGSGAPGGGLAVAVAEVGEAVGDELAPDLAAPVFDGGGGVVDGDLDGADELGDGGLLVGSAGGKGETGVKLAPAEEARRRARDSFMALGHRSGWGERKPFGAKCSRLGTLRVCAWRRAFVLGVNFSAAEAS